MRHPDYPHADSYQDRHGKPRWRFRRSGRTVSLPGAPGEPAFDAAYRDALEGREKRQPAPVVRLPGQTVPRSLKAAWLILRQHDPEWQALGPDIKTAQTRIAERFLTTPVVEGEALTFGEVAVEHLRRKHVKALLAARSETPHAAAHLLRVIRKLVGIALDQEWIEIDPTYRLKYRPAYGGWKAWPDEMLDRFEAHWPIGTTPRLVYSLALYFGHRRSDVSRVKPADLAETSHNVVQQKTGKALTLPIHPNLADVLAAIDDLPQREFVAMTAWGKPFSAKGLTVRMRDWTKAAGLPPGYTLHGLRKTLGKALAEHEATTRQLMDVLGHDNMEHAELYSREAEQKKMAAAGMQKLMNWRRKPG
ncbi:tyrosine-type recombinase/integrase [Bradyrhizobium sp. BR 10261]|uniref:tyrosine-type recombinase/integrase n=1 Tax=Bradyrhizobium sp. BR 10261 TaxID=2749992 RepID=UPI001C647052|nr:tyrosine-type recombinase/integrase [Bradyrhizobium sp. BR 10261]MBW7966763.1 tyrosine-type recombinase/integrase [Bradyrhizobium sp. BR 10261]